MQKIHWVHFGKCEEELHKICWVFLPSMTSQWWSRELLWHPSPISPANIFPLTTSCSWPTSLSRVRFRLCVDSHRPCSSRSGARQRGWSHFRCGKVSPGCYFLPSPRTNVRNRLFTLAPLSIINISRRKNWCLMWSGSLRFSSAANKWLQLRMKRRCGGQRSSCHAAGGEEMEEINKPRVVCCDGRSGSRVKCAHRSVDRRSVIRCALASCVALEQREQLAAPTCSGIWLQTLSVRLRPSAGSLRLLQQTHHSPSSFCLHKCFISGALPWRKSGMWGEKHVALRLRLC